ncbi:hypothetical protein [Crocinitomix algicola]|uniref:hypothetical protein n=1 Tax=Crocinitomix algicola TaxID=1740263 RepID=UPI0008733604|nr:hypothetical protein [Crocinitomix algicola]
MKFKLRKKEAKKNLLAGLVNLLVLIYFSRQILKNKAVSEEFSYIIQSVVAVLVIILLVNTYIKMKKLIILDLTEENLKYQYIRNKIEKNSIRKIDLIHGHVNSFALVFMKNQPESKIYQLRNKYFNYKYGTPYLINLDKIEGEVTETYQKLLEWKKTVYNNK